MDSKRLRRIVTVALVVLAAAVLVHLIFNDKDGAPPVLTIINQSREPVRELRVLLDSGEVYTVDGALEDGERRRVVLDAVSGEAELTLSLLSADGARLESEPFRIEVDQPGGYLVYLQPEGGFLFERDLETEGAR